MFLSRFAEEMFPFCHYFLRAHKKIKLSNSEDILLDKNFAGYGNLVHDQLVDRLKEERTRASQLDDKTFKLTLSLSFGLTVLGSTTAFLTKAVASHMAQIALAFLVGGTLFYVLMAGFVALGALKTLPSFGYGTAFLIQLQTCTADKIADALARQETMNLVRHLRNETAYMALRNGLILLFIGLSIFAATIAFETFYPSIKP